LKSWQFRHCSRGDLNDCEYHAAGAKEINNQFDAFKIAVTWELKKSTSHNRRRAGYVLSTSYFME